MGATASTSPKLHQVTVRRSKHAGSLASSRTSGNSAHNSDAYQPQIQTTDTNPFLQRLAAYWRGESNLAPQARSYFVSARECYHEQQQALKRKREGNDSLQEREAKRPRTNTPTPNYTFTKLSELNTKENSIVNLYGIVVDYDKTPVKTGGTDSKITVKIIDDTCPSPDFSLSVNIFGISPQHFPRIKCRGEIIRMLRISIQNYNGRPQGVGKKGVSEYVVVDGAVYAPITPRHSGPREFSGFSESEVARIQELREFEELKTASEDICPFNTKYYRRLSDVRSGEYVDVVGKLLHITPITTDANTNRRKLRLYISDYLQPPHATNLDEARKTDIRRFFLQINAFDPFIDVLIAQRCGTWLHFRNVNIWSPDGYFVEASTCHNSAVAELTDESPEVQWIRRHNLPSSTLPSLVGSDWEDAAAKLAQQQHGIVLKPNQGVVPPSLQIQQPPTRVLHDTVPLSTLRDVLTCSQPTYKFHVVARVIGHVPSRIEEFAVPSSAPATSGTKYCYMFKLLLKDATASLEAIVYGEDAEQFLPGLPPADLVANNCTRELLQKRLERLQQPDTWAHFCLKSYYVDKALLEDRRYRVFDTILYS